MAGRKFMMRLPVFRGKTICLFVCFLIAVIGIIPASAQTGRGNIDVDAINAYITAKMKAPRIPGLAVAIVRGDEIVFLKGYGIADPSGRRVTPQTPFIIGSVTKSFTALAAMQLAEAGKIELDAPVQTYLPWFRVADPVASGKITVRQLILQTSGLPMLREPQLWEDPDDRALERTVRFLKTAEMDFPPGESFGYSNANYETLGMIVQDVSGQSYEQYIQEHIFDPLGMTNSFTSQREALQHGMATGYRWWFGIPAPVTFPYNRSELPAGYIISSAEDMARYLIAQMNGGRYRNHAVLSAKGIALTHTVPVPGRYGMGWESLQANGHKLINHDGGTANFQSSLFFDPKERVGVFIVANAMCALDAFSSPHGSSILDGSTLRAMAQTVLSRAMNQPRPSQGPGIRTLYVIFDLVILALTVALIISLIQIPKRYIKLKENGMATRSGFIRRIGLISVLHFVWPLTILFVAVFVPVWKAYMMFQPDLGYWLVTVAVTVFVKGVLELVLTYRTVGRSGSPNCLVKQKG